MPSRLVALFVVIGSVLLPCSARAAERPNVVVILSDDQGWGDLSVHGNTNLSTPRIDSLARDGAIFDRFFVCPVCSPTRAEFLTGRYHVRGGVFGVSEGGERLDLDERTIAQVFKQGGYATAVYGKWHNGMQYPYHPLARGFNEHYGFCSGHWGEYFSPALEHNGEPVRGDGFIADDLTNHALGFIEQHRQQPFFCYLAFNTPHTPLQVPDRFYDKFKHADLKMRHTGAPPEDIEFTRAALAMCENIDWNVGRVLDKLHQLQLADNTIVLYFADNGPNSWRWNGGMRGRKGSTDEGGVRSPLLVRWPGHIPAQTRVTQIAGAIDLLPTLAELAGVSIEGGKPLDGVSVAPLLRGNATNWPERLIFSYWGHKVSVRSQQYRLDAAGKLYDMTQDPGQTADVAGKQPDVAAKLRAAVERWRSDVLSELTEEARPFTVGYRAFPLTQLPARDGIEHGTVKRSSKAPNCSFFTHWTSPQDSITWDIEVATAGRYEAVVYYTCAAADVGSQIVLSFGDSRVEAKVTEAHDPPLVGAADDRVPRKGESYVKDFKPMRLGEIHLDNGRGQLTLRAPQVAGKQVMDVRSIYLKLLD
jgi:arylsulfatase A-like enzyme